MIGFLAASPRRQTRALRIALVVLALALSACGRNGDPLPPPDANAPPQANSGDLSGGFGRPSNPPIAKPHTPFLLDPLL